MNTQYEISTALHGEAVSTTNVASVLQWFCERFANWFANDTTSFANGFASGFANGLANGTTRFVNGFSNGIAIDPPANCFRSVQACAGYVFDMCWQCVGMRTAYEVWSL